ncbi:hypothetical protein [Planctobacterium marinum]|uniref:Uncharacterized protein n=1 Tax=Planctobacterium marinum TaxID=1631968 RepID=A0AA48HJS0_9ALTE|nr:hypothetical protein MACH26_03880 [Planctobacterium marinum]
MDWFSAALKGARTLRAPFLHSQLSCVLPADLHQDMLQFFPQQQDMFLVGKGARDKGIRHHLFLNERLEQQISNQRAADFWLSFWHAVHQQAANIKKQAIQYFEHWQLFPGIHPSEIKLGVRLVDESLPYTMAPHIDQAFKLAVMVVYLHSDELMFSQGTQLYNKQENDSLSAVSALPFEPNAGVFMPRVRNSWHGGHWSGYGHRKTLHFYFFKAQGEGQQQHISPVYF